VITSCGTYLGSAHSQNALLPRRDEFEAGECVQRVDGARGGAAVVAAVVVAFGCRETVREFKLVRALDAVVDEHASLAGQGELCAPQRERGDCAALSHATQDLWPRMCE
jgi:hypothetical protein